jgi:hypothetical protein
MPVEGGVGSLLAGRWPDIEEGGREAALGPTRSLLRPTADRPFRTGPCAASGPHHRISIHTDRRSVIHQPRP